MQAAVTALSLTAVKGTRLRTVDRIELGRDGARGDRSFFIIDQRNRMINGKQVGELSAIVADYAEDVRRLGLTFPDGRVVEDHVELGDAVTARFYSRSLAGRLLEGPWSQALSDFTDRPLRLVEPVGGAVDRGRQGGVSLISGASLQRLAEVAGEPTVDARRFRMLIEIGGVAAHEEDGWIGRIADIGGTRVRFAGHIGRCVITSRDPDTGEIDLPTLDVLGDYRRGIRSTEPLPFGIYGAVVTGGTIATGDPVTLVG